MRLILDTEGGATLAQDGITDFRSATRSKTWCGATACFAATGVNLGRDAQGRALQG